MNTPLRTYIFVFFIYYLGMLLSTLFILFFINVYGYLRYASANVSFWSLFNEVFFNFLIFMPIISALGLTGLYFSRR